MPKFHQSLRSNQRPLLVVLSSICRVVSPCSLNWACLLPLRSSRSRLQPHRCCNRWRPAQGSTRVSLDQHSVVQSENQFPQHFPCLKLRQIWQVSFGRLLLPIQKAFSHAGNNRVHRQYCQRVQYFPEVCPEGCGALCMIKRNILLRYARCGLTGEPRPRGKKA
jgi:hypothetical protein